MAASNRTASARAADLHFALELADLADRISLAHFRSDGLQVASKPDLSPVSVADQEIEAAIRRRVAAERPGEAVFGEEEGGAATGGRRWIVDPIDGTRKFVRGVPAFATLIALEEDGELVLGVASAPALGLRWWAARGLGAYRNGRPIRVSTVARLEDAHVCHGNLEGWVRTGQLERLAAVIADCWGSSGYGDFWMHLLVAEGAADAALEPTVEVWDLAAIKVIVEEAGGRLTNLEGVSSAAGGSALSSNGYLHAEILRRLHAT